MDNMQTVKDLIMKALPDAEVEISDLTGTNDHLGVSVTSSTFKGKPLIQQHQMIMDILKEKLQSDVHAVQIKTKTK